jgi:hypothetical protein
MLDKREQRGNIISPLRRLKSMLEAMIPPMGTLVFLATFWLLVVMGAAVLEESGARIAAALKGDPAGEISVRMTGARRHSRARAQRSMSGGPRWRAAA